MPLNRHFSVSFSSSSITEEINLYLWEITESVSQLLEMLPFVSITDIPAKAESKQQEWLIERIIIQQVLDNEAILLHHANGAPYLQGSYLNISVSHTKGYVLIALSSSAHFGVDIESISHRINNVLKHYVLPQEEVFYVNKTPAEALTDKLILWSAKESIFKSQVEGKVNTMLDAEILQMQESKAVLPWSRVGECSAILHPQEQELKVQYFTTSAFVLTVSCYR